MDLYRDALNRMCKWRAHLAGWQLGTRTTDDAECQAVRDHREATLLLRAEVTALTALLVKKGVFSVDEFTRTCAEEAEHLCAAMERRWPGCKSELDGMHYTLPAAQESMRGWRP